MTILPFFNQFIVPAFISIYAVISVFLPQSSLHGKEKKAVMHEKKVISAHITPTVTPEEKVVQVNKNDKKDTANTQNNEEQAKDTSSQADESASHVSLPIPTSTSVPTVTPQESISALITAKTTITVSGKTIHLVMKYPSVGGSISGTIAGDCSGSLTGTYNGPQSQTLSGVGKASCSLGFMNVTANLTYSGRLTSATSAHIDYTVSALGKTESGSTDLALNN